MSKEIAVCLKLIASLVVLLSVFILTSTVLAQVAPQEETTGRRVFFAGAFTRPMLIKQLSHNLTANGIQSTKLFNGRCLSWSRYIDEAEVNLFSTADMFWISMSIESTEGFDAVLEELLRTLAKENGLPELASCQITDSINIPVSHPDGTVDMAGMQVSPSPYRSFYRLVTIGKAAAQFNVPESAISMELGDNQVNWVANTAEGEYRIPSMSYHRQEYNLKEPGGVTYEAQQAEPVFSSEDAVSNPNHVDYVIMYKSSLTGWEGVINALHTKHSDYQDLTFSTNVSERLVDLQAIQPNYVLIVISPEDGDPDFFDDADMTMCQIDDDEFEDAVWAIITGFDAAHALELVNAPNATDDHTLNISNPDGDSPMAGYTGLYLESIISDDDTLRGTSTHYISASGANYNCTAPNLGSEINGDNKDIIIYSGHGNPASLSLYGNDIFGVFNHNLGTTDGLGAYLIDNNRNSFVLTQSCLATRIHGSRDIRWSPWELNAFNMVGNKDTSIALGWLAESPGFFAGSYSTCYQDPHSKIVLLNMMKFGYTPAKAVQITKNVYHLIIDDETSENNPADGDVDDILSYLQRNFLGLGDTDWNVDIEGNTPDYSIDYTGHVQQDQESTTRGYVYVDNDVKWRCTVDFQFNEEIVIEPLDPYTGPDHANSPFTFISTENAVANDGNLGYDDHSAAIGGIFTPGADTTAIDFVDDNPSDTDYYLYEHPWEGSGTISSYELFKCKTNTNEIVWVVGAGHTDADSDGRLEWRINDGFSKNFDVYYHLPGVKQTVGGEAVVDSDTRQKSVILENTGSRAVANVIAKVPVPEGASSFLVSPGTGVTSITMTSNGGSWCEFTVDSIDSHTTKNLTLQYDIAGGAPSVTTDNATNVTSNSASLNGILNDLGAASTVYVSFEWGLDTSYGNETPPQAMTSTGPVSFDFTSLSPGTSYNFRAKAVGDGTSYGSDKGFTTTEGDDTGWSQMDSGTTSYLWGVCGTSASDVFAVGSWGTILHYDGDDWSSMNSGVYPLWIGHVWCNSPSDVFAVGALNTILHYNGTDWSSMSSGTMLDFSGLWGSSSSDVFAVSSSGTILHYDGTSWEMRDSGTTNFLSSVWGTSSSDVFAVGNMGTIIHYDGSAWGPMVSGTTKSLWCVSGSSPSDVYAVGADGTILHYDGTTWSSMASSTTTYLRTVWCGSPNSVFAAGFGGTIVHFNGSIWTAMPTGITSNLRDIWGLSTSDVFAVGDNGTILHYYTEPSGPWSPWNYDNNPTNGAIDILEVLTAISDYFGGQITILQLLQVISLYFSG
ncbi:hypothetical protein ACFLWH_00230 [Chloroflexota bacterium]